MFHLFSENKPKNEDLPNKINESQIRHKTSNFQNHDSNSLLNEIKAIKQQNQLLFNEFSFQKKEIESIKNQINSVLVFLKTPMSQSNKIKSINIKKTFDKFHSKQVSFLYQLSDKRIVSCAYDGSISITSFNYLDNTFNSSIIIKNAHTKVVTSVCEISNKRIVSASFDYSLKVWDISNIRQIQPISTIKEHTGIIYKVISLTNDRFCSCSSEDNTVKIWDSKTFKKINIPFENQEEPFTLIQLKHQNEVLVINCSTGNGYLNFFNLCPPFNREGTICGVVTNDNNGLIELSNGHIAASANHPPCIYIADPIHFTIHSIIKDNNYIICGSCLNKINDNSFIYAYNG